MATLLQKIETELGDLASFDPDDLSGNTNEPAIAAYVAKVQQLEALFGLGGGLGCLIGCYPAYLECRRNNPSSFPDICQELLQSCIYNCQNPQ